MSQQRLNEVKQKDSRKISFDIHRKKALVTIAKNGEWRGLEAV